MRISGGIVLGIVVGALFMLIEHLIEGIDPRDFWGIARPVGTIGIIVGTVVGLVWECTAGVKQPPAVKPIAPTPDGSPK